MITITIPKSSWFDDKKSEIVKVKKEITLTLEFSLVSISKWEMKFHKPFLTQDKNIEDYLYFFYCMIINPPKDFDPRWIYAIKQEDFTRVKEYMEDPMSATVIINEKKNDEKPPKAMTSEELYCAMSMLNIPYECQKWHLNRLIKLIELCAIKNAPPEKMSEKEALKSWQNVNAQNRAKFKSKG